jgi:hypothetical protein
MPRPRRPDRERIALPMSETRWLWLCGLKTLDELREDHDLEAFAIYLDDTSRDHYPTPRRELWEQHREAALRYIAEATPGKRPDAFWEYEAPEPLRQLSGRTVRQWHPPVQHRPGDADWTAWRNCKPGEGYWKEIPDPADPPTYESSAAYLRRLGLLMPGELRRLAAADFEPEVVTS